MEDFLTFRLTRLSNALRTNLTKPYLEEFELSLPEWRLLALVARFAPMRFSEVTARSSMDKGQVSRTLRVMAKRGLDEDEDHQGSAARARPKRWRRRSWCRSRRRARALYKAVLPVARSRQADMLLTLDEKERVALYSTHRQAVRDDRQRAMAEEGE